MLDYAGQEAGDHFFMRFEVFVDPAQADVFPRG